MDKDGALDRDEFAVAMHLVVCASKRGMAVPEALPRELVPPSKAHIFGLPSGGVVAAAVSGLPPQGAGFGGMAASAAAAPPAPAPSMSLADALSSLDSLVEAPPAKLAAPSAPGPVPAPTPSAPEAHPGAGFGAAASGLPPRARGASDHSTSSGAGGTAPGYGAGFGHPSISVGTPASAGGPAATPSGGYAPGPAAGFAPSAPYAAAPQPSPYAPQHLPPQPSPAAPYVPAAGASTPAGAAPSGQAAGAGPAAPAEVIAAAKEVGSALQSHLKRENVALNDRRGEVEAAHAELRFLEGERAMFVRQLESVRQQAAEEEAERGRLAERIRGLKAEIAQARAADGQAHTVSC